MTSYELHPLCTLFPRLAGAEFEALRDDIKVNGLRSPIVLHDGMILDGGNRYRACVDAGVEPVFVPFRGQNIVSFVLSVNLHRRHMTAGQQAAIVASASDWAKSQGRGRPTKKPEGLPVFQTAAERAAVSGATERTQRDADRLVRENPALAKEVAQGTKSLYRAVQEAKPLKPAPEPAAAGAEEFGPSEEEIRAAEQDLQAELDSLRRVVESDDRLAAAMAEVKQYREESRVLRERRDGLMSQCNEQIRMIKSLQRKLAKLEQAA